MYSKLALQLIKQEKEAQTGILDLGKCGLWDHNIPPELWKLTAFREVQALPQKGQPISKYADSDDFWKDVSDGIKKVLDDMLKAK